MGKTKFSCNNCGNVESKWNGQCSACKEWNCIVELAESFDNDANAINSNLKILSLSDLELQKIERLKSDFISLDNILGGGFVVGGVVLLAGEPGVGKSTLLLQLTCNIKNILYISAEESIEQIGLRAKRLNHSQKDTFFVTTTNINEVIVAINKQPNISMVIIDSIQMLSFSSNNNLGAIGQVRNITSEIVNLVKSLGISAIIVSHITKDGQIAGPKIIEHMVDAVLYFEGDNNHQYRILRSVKNRFGPTNEMAIFNMNSNGLQEVENPALMFLESHLTQVSGSVIFPMITNGKVIFLEIQALVTPANNLQNPQRSVVGLDLNRVIMLLAVLHARYKISFAGKDIYMNVAGGLKINETAVDLAIIIALISAYKDIPINKNIAVFGEIGLSGEVRQVNYLDQRIKEVERFSFKKIICHTLTDCLMPNLEMKCIKQIKDLKSILDDL